MRFLAAMLLVILPACQPRECLSATVTEVGENWTCAQQGIAATDPPSISRYIVKGDLLIGDKAEQFLIGSPYRILQNNDFGLVAVTSNSSVDRESKNVSIGNYSIIINKNTMEVMWVEAFFNRPLSFTRGKCLHN